MTLLSIVLLMTQSSAATCLKYDIDVVVVGKLIEQTFPEQPNYESIEKGDVPATYYFLDPSPALCVLPGSGPDERAADIDSLQIVFPANGDAYKALRSSLGRDVKCTGRLMPEISGHHHTPILLADAVCAPR
ncbi:MAG: DUF4431 domain-containing protein [Rudaea sp.]